jgi:hypothetical protein
LSLQAALLPRIGIKKSYPQLGEVMEAAMMLPFVGNEPFAVTAETLLAAA